MKTTFVFALSLVVLSTMAIAKPKPENLIKYRQSAMMFMRWNVGTIKKQVVKKPQSYNQQQVSDAAKAIAAVANSNLPALFAPGTETGAGWKETRARAGLFERPEDLVQHLSTLRQEANELVRVADSGDIDLIRPQFEKTFQACRSCHKDFRNK